MGVKKPGGSFLDVFFHIYLKFSVGFRKESSFVLVNFIKSQIIIAPPSVT